MDLTLIRQFAEQCRSIVAVDPERAEEVLANLEDARSELAELALEILLDKYGR